MGLSHLLQVHTLCFIIWFQYQHKIPTFLDVIKTNLSRNSPHTEPVEETTTIPVLQTFATGFGILPYSVTLMESSASAHQSKTLVVKMNLQYPPTCQEVYFPRCAMWRLMRRTRRIMVPNWRMTKVRIVEAPKKLITKICHH